MNHFINGDCHSELAEALQSYGMERAFESSQKCIKVSLARVYNGPLILKTEEKSLSIAATFLTSAI